MAGFFRLFIAFLGANLYLYLYLKIANRKRAFIERKWIPPNVTTERILMSHKMFNVVLAVSFTYVIVSGYWIFGLVCVVF